MKMNLITDITKDIYVVVYITYKIHSQNSSHTGQSSMVGHFEGLPPLSCSLSTQRPWWYSSAGP